MADGSRPSDDQVPDDEAEQQPGDWSTPEDAVPSPAAMAMLDAGLAAIADRERQFQGRRNMWLAHHWPDEYAERCVHIGGRWVCRRCAALYPFGLLVAIVSYLGAPPWPESIDPWPIWLLSIPATVAYCGEAIGLFRYSAKWQVATTLLAAIAFGRALAYELESRWSPEFWRPIAVFGGIWFLFTVLGMQRRSRAARVGGARSGRQ